MTWPLRFCETWPDDPKVGDWWYCPWMIEGETLESLRSSPFFGGPYRRDVYPSRPPICVVCPGGETWIIDGRSSNGDGWTVTGVPGAITARPSIVTSNYHGFLTDGVFSDDLEGRMFP